tara:strand:- start:59 stop:208 length:150 start_codon:yes stop_codon:yes gene_type:complete
MRIIGEKIILIWSKNRRNSLIENASRRRTPRFLKNTPRPNKLKQEVNKH